MTIRTILAGGALALLALPAAAATMLVDVTGTVASVTDLNDVVFGGSVVVGSEFTLTYSYDLSVGNQLTFVDQDGNTFLSFTSGEANGTPPAVEATFSAGTASIVIDASNIGDDGTDSGIAVLVDSDDAAVSPDLAGYNAFTFDLVDGLQVSTQALFSVQDDLLGLSDDFETPYSIIGDPDTNSLTGSFALLGFDPDVGDNTTYAYLDLVGQQVTVTYIPDDPSPVPLPASGVLLVAAMGGLGALRRRRG